jgi:glucokinase
MKAEKENALTFGVDIGGTKVDTALIDSNGKIVASRYLLLRTEAGPDQVISRIIAAAHECRQESGTAPAGMGVGVAGQIDKVSGIVRCSPNLPGWQDVPLRDRLQGALGIPVVIDNDVRMITRGEWTHGAGKGINDLVCLFVGTGVGGGIVNGGRLVEGCRNTAGELGHTTIVVNGRQCHCPNQGCLEAYAGGWAIAERAREAVSANPERGKTLLTLAGRVDQISSITVSEAYREGDPLANALVQETAQFLAAGVVSIVNVFNPCVLILGGGVIHGTPEYISMVEKFARTHALQTPVENLRIVAAALGNKAGVVGAAALARNLLKAA